MNITLSKAQVTEIVSLAGMVIPRRCNLPVLEHVRFRLTGSGGLEIAATDLEQTVLFTLAPESAEGAGEFLMPLAELRTVKSSLKGRAAVTIETAGPDTLRVITRTAAGSLVHPCESMPVDEFPADPPDTGLADCDLDAFLTACRAAAASASTDERRGIITGICLDPKEKAVIGTDGRRLTKKPVADLPLGTGAVLPVTKALLKLDPGAGTGRIGVREGTHDAVFELRTDSVRYVCKCMPGTYPNYRQVIPGSIGGFPYTVVFSDSGLDTIGSLAPHVRNDSTHPLFIAGHDGKAAAGIETADGSGCAALLPDCRFSGPQAAAVAVNCDLLRTALRYGFREMRMQDALTPLCFSDGADGLHLIMPLRGEPSAALASQFETILGGAVSPVKARADEPAQEDEPVTEDEPVPDAQTEPEPQPVTAEDKEEPEMTEEKKPAEAHKPDLKMIGTEDDPLARLDELVAESQEALKQADTAVRELRKQVRAVKAAYREREKEMAKNLTLIGKLQEAMAA